MFKICAWAELHCKLEAVASTVPAASVYLDNRPVKLPWSSTALKRMRKNKDRAWADFDIDPSDINFSNAMSKQHTFEEEEFKAKVSYEKKITSDLKHNSKAFLHIYATKDKLNLVWFLWIEEMEHVQILQLGQLRFLPLLLAQCLYVNQLVLYRKV
ncbi:hypothetical protein ACHWQZ_G009034 [Mnemiopsis leidyi]